MSFGFKMARLLATFLRHKSRLSELRARLLVVEFGGAVGTLATLPENLALKCQEKIAKEFALGAPEIAWHSERDRIAEVGSFFALLTSTCSKFALDLKLMMQTEVGEVSEPFVPYRGSSSTVSSNLSPDMYLRSRSTHMSWSPRSPQASYLSPSLWLSRHAVTRSCRCRRSATPSAPRGSQALLPQSASLVLASSRPWSQITSGVRGPGRLR